MPAANVTQARVRIKTPRTPLLKDYGFLHRFTVAFADFVDCSWRWTRELSIVKPMLCGYLFFYKLVHLIFKQTETRRPFWLFVLLLAIPACLTFLYIPHSGSTILAAVKVFSLFWSTLATSILVYRVSPWHPLAKYPGPFLCKPPNFALLFSLLAESSLSTILNYTENMAMLFESVSRSYSIHWIDFYHSV